MPAANTPALKKRPVKPLKPICNAYNMACPGCGRSDTIIATIEQEVELRADTTERIDDDHGWRDDSPCRCNDCDYAGTVADFKLDANGRHTLVEKPAVLRVLDLSTAHLKPTTLDFFDSAHPEAWPCSGGVTSYGYFFYALDENTSERPIPADLWKAMQYARHHDCAHLLFDRDAGIAPGLKTYKHR